MKVVISGYFGFGNLGDEAILEAMIIGLRQKYPSIGITVLSASPEKTSEAYNVFSINRYRLSEIIAAIKGCDVLISGGGGLIQDSTGPFTASYYLGIIYLAKFYRKTAVIIGQGIGPIRRFYNRLLCRFVLNRADMIIVRDERSSDDLIRLGIRNVPIHVAGDVTPLLVKPSPQVVSEILRSEGIQKDGRPFIGISIRKPNKKMRKEEADLYYRLIASSADHLIEKFGARLAFIPFHYPNDIVESSKVINLMNNPVNIILREYTPVEMLGIISEMDLFVGMRLHSLIFSAMAEVPLIGIEYDPKVRRLTDLIRQRCLSIEDIDRGELTRTVEEVWTAKERLRSALAEWSKGLSIKAKLNFEIFQTFLKTQMKRELLGISFDNITMAEAISKIEGMIGSGSPHMIVTPNPEILMRCRKDPAFRSIISGSAMILPDGFGILWASNVLRAPIRERITGIDLAEELARLCAEKGYKLFLLGSKPGVAEGAAEFLVKKYPRIKIVGTYHGYFPAEEDQRICERISALKPDIVLVGLGSPKQEEWMAERLERLGAPVCIGIGGSLDVLAGRVRRAPAWMRRSRLEWLYRLLMEPWRFRRQAALLRFFFLVLYTKMFSKKPKRA